MYLMQVALAKERIEELQTVDVIGARVLVDRFFQQIPGRSFPPLPFPRTP